MQVQSLGHEDPLEKEMTTHSSILAWEITCTEKTVGLYSPQGRKRVRHSLATKQQQQCPLSAHFLEIFFIINRSWILSEAFYFFIYWDDHMFFFFIFQFVNALLWASQVVLVVRNLPANAGEARDLGLIPGSRRSSGEGNGNLLQYSWWDNSCYG